MSQLPVVVVGAGPVGCTAALLLARRGIDVLLLERRPAPPAVPRAVHLDDEALRALADAGVAEEFLAVSRPMAGLRLLDAGHRVLAEFARDPGAGRHGWPQASMFHQPDLEAVLRAAVDRAPRVTLRAPAEVTGLTERPDRSVTVALAGGARLDAAAVLGCDGAHSTVRRLTGARMRTLARPDRWLVVDLRAPSPLPVWPGVHQVCDPARAATFMPVSGDRYRFETRLLDGGTAAALTAPEVLRPLLAPFGADGAEVVRAAEYVYRAQVADRWRRGRVLLAGDAAHLTPPFVGQGLGLGLRDVHQLAWKVAAVVTGGADDALLDTHGAERGPHARALVRMAALVGGLMTGGGAGAVPVRRAVLAAVGRVPALAAYATDSRTPPLRRGPLVDRGGPAGRRLAGTLVPRARVRVDGRECRLDDVLGSGTAVLALAPSGLTLTAGGRRALLDDVDGALTAWLGGGRARWVVVRPDRVVRAAG
ncbi:bifunctional 3-(3-hydroxy-phenyl)propionate/3-hydroxycinnamic acid hydroxylase [Geodermatophilus nigrescens]|uniref:3-(3-hydroxy-phenyl)propionate hydroxylase n=1 Tax=Geodermatophilus nigrescens TaxID=1070870 RepID=A0A1M5LH29_9ACTN|nr:bifunctional 3-(3-hydroxy-phenyl)propionate/3-hydroxycinnamic acid hydroxylase [Geodermatophilus nigrescens]SHG64308.1 3-(3-hydroxy-phenyl)propionate hydroxylase [Geodermatophilus nigrescens]